nr:MAG TPA: tail assembly chaperone protein [Caudoviricetes sp.]
MASKRYELVKKYYDKRLWTRKMLKNAVVKGWITQDEYDEIVGVTGAPAETDGGETAPDYEQMAADVRAKRGALLAASDYTQATDYPSTYAARTAWAEYRQQLRDVTKQAGFPAEVVWPWPPTEV